MLLCESFWLLQSYAALEGLGITVSKWSSDQALVTLFLCLKPLEHCAVETDLWLGAPFDVLCFGLPSITQTRKLLTTQMKSDIPHTVMQGIGQFDFMICKS